ncbi:hypothetical protein EGR_10326 [Echinococcus granulosus]|uniref:Uncharacterized protein n=1 Tax=Echinococcus granulosus TaxID=6210 RepID=W6UMU9_ECHGR|nr:hypothetical protein EGR_10326 [Echinococcus granulosus]EUB54819.1 hypothetical protein EGR_10326 [Echinococcus granulosus]
MNPVTLLNYFAIIFKGVGASATKVASYFKETGTAVVYHIGQTVEVNSDLLCGLSAMRTEFYCDKFYTAVFHNQTWMNGSESTVGLVLDRQKITEGLPGGLCICFLQVTILPNIVAYIITVFAVLNPKQNNKMRGVTLAYIFAFNLISLPIGLTHFILIKPGLPGGLYICFLQFTILPKIVANTITVFAVLNPKQNNKMRGVTLAYIFAFNPISLLIGQTYSILINPSRKPCGSITSISTNPMRPQCEGAAFVAALIWVQSIVGAEEAYMLGVVEPIIMKLTLAG